MVDKQGDTILTDLGIDVKHLRPGLAWGSEEKLEKFLKELGAEVQEVELVEFECPAIPAQDMAERHRAKIYSGEWHLPQEIHSEAVRRIEKWLDKECPELGRRMSSKGNFKMLAARGT